MKIAYVSNFRLDMPSLGEYSHNFLDVLSSIEGAHVTCLDLGKFDHQSSSKVRKSAQEKILSFDRAHSGFDIYYLEITNHHQMVWLVTSLKTKLGGAKIVATIHDPPLPVTGYMQMYFPFCGGLAKKIARTLDLLKASHLLLRNTVNCCDGLVFLTESGQKAFMGHYNFVGKCLSLPHVNFNGESYSEPPVYCAPQSGALSVFYAGHWWKHKGIEDLIDACYELSIRGLKVDLCLSGSGPESYVKHVASYLRGKEHEKLSVDIPGLIDIEEMYRRGRMASCWVIPYRETGKVAGSGVIARAMYAGAHLIVSDLPQILDCLDEGVDCEVFHAGDSSDLADKIASSRDVKKSRMLRSHLIRKNNTIHSKKAIAGELSQFVSNIIRG